MRKLLRVAALAAVVIVDSGAVIAADQSVEINATVNAFCTIVGTEASAALVTLNLGSFGPSGIGPGNAATAIMGQVICNKASSVTLSSAKSALLVGAGAAAVPGLQNYISYNATTVAFPTAQATFAAISATGVAAVGTGTTVNQAGAFNSTSIRITITPVLNLAPLLAGAYQDTLTMTVIPQ